MAKKTVGIELRRLSNLIAREVSKATKDVPDENITEMHVNIIEYLIEHGEDGVMQKDIEHEFTIRKSTASRILQLMEKRGVISRQGVDYDARQKKITLTHRAIERHRFIMTSAKEMEQRMTDGISDSDLETFFSVLLKMQSNLKG